MTYFTPISCEGKTYAKVLHRTSQNETNTGREGKREMWGVGESASFYALDRVV